MSLNFNGTTVEDVVYNGTALCKLVYNGTLVWESHSYGDWSTTTAATCTTTGTRRRDCSRCDAYETATLDALGHSYSLLKVDPTCTMQGYTLHECTRDGCPYSYKDSYLGALGHDYGDWTITTAATCTTVGSKKRTCSRTVCGASETATIASLGHSYGSATYTWASDYSTCTATRVCQRDSSHTQTARGTVTSSITTAATCTTDGVRTYSASFEESWCASQNKTVTIPASHTIANYPYVAPTTTSIGYTGGSYCSVCGRILSARTPILATPVITDIILSDQAYIVDVWVKNNNSVAVTCYVSLIDDDGAGMGDTSFVIAANTSGYTSIEYSSSATLPLECYVYFEPNCEEAYEDSEEVSGVI